MTGSGRSALAALVAVCVMGAVTCTAMGRPRIDAPVAISSSTEPSSAPEGPALSYDPVSGRVLVAWLHGTGDGKSVAARVLDAAGHPVGQQLELSAFGLTRGALTIVPAGRTGGFLVSALAGGEQYDQPVTPTTVLVRSNGLVGPTHGVAPQVVYSSTGYYTSFALAADPRVGRIMAIWYRSATPSESGGVFTEELSAAGEPRGPVHTVYRARSTAASPAGSSIEYVPSLKRWLVMFVRQTSSPRAMSPTAILASRLLDAHGKPADSVRRVADLTKSGGPVFETLLGASPAQRMTLLGGYDDRLRMIPLDARGRRSGPIRYLTPPERRDPPIKPAGALVTALSHGTFITYQEECDPTSPADAEACPIDRPIAALHVSGSRSRTTILDSRARRGGLAMIRTPHGLLGAWIRLSVDATQPELSAARIHP